MTEKKTTQTKASLRNGRATKGGAVYNANHNTLESIRRDQPHIDAQKFELNRYFKFTEDGRSFKVKTIQGGQGGFDSRKHEKDVYEKRYKDGLEARNERYRKEGHPERCQTITRLYSNPKTAPLETLFQIGNSQMIEDGTMTPQELSNKLTIAWKETMKQIVAMGQGHVIPLDAALHCEESVPHIHFRAALGATDRYGYFVPNQNAALAAMGFDGRNPETGKKDRYHNPLVAYTDRIREIFYAECEKLHLVIDREVTSESHRQKELLAFKCEKYREENQALEQQGRELRQQAREAEARAARAEEKTQAAQEALERVLGDTDTLKSEITALRASQAALEAKNKHSVEYGVKLKARLDEVIQEGKAMVAENGKLQAVNEQLRAENKQLHQENDQLQKSAAAARQEVQASMDRVADLENQVAALEMQMEQLRLVKTQAEREAAQAQEDKKAAVKAAQDMHKQQRELYMSYAKGANAAKTYGEVEARAEKKNLRGQVTQEARPACVLVEKDGFERMQKAAGYHYAVDYTQTQIDKLEKAISENEIIQGLRNQVEQQQQEINHLSNENRRLTQQKQKDDWTIEQLEQTLGAYNIPNPTQQQSHTRHQRHR